MNLFDWRTRYTSYLKDSQNASNTQESYLFHLDAFFDTVGDRISSVYSTEQLVSVFLDYIVQKDVGPSSKKVSLAAFRKLVTMLGGDSSSIKLRLPKKVKSGVKHLTEEQIRVIIGSIDDDFSGIREAAIFSIFSHLGLRLSELSNLTMGDLDFEHNQIHVIGKGMTEGYVPIIDIVRPALFRWLSVRPEGHSNCLWLESNGECMKRRKIQYRMSKLVKQFDKRLSTHSLRHTAATTLINRGVELKTVQALLRHTTIRTTGDIYAHKDVDSVGIELNEVYGG